MEQCKKRVTVVDVENILQTEPSITKFGFDTTENGPPKFWVTLPPMGQSNSYAGLLAVGAPSVVVAIEGHLPTDDVELTIATELTKE